MHVLVCSGLVCTQLSVRGKELVLLYDNGEEEVISGTDFDDMLANDHLLASGTCWGGGRLQRLPRVEPCMHAGTLTQH